MEVKNIPTPLDEAFVVQAIIPPGRIAIEAIDVADLSKGVSCIASLLAISLPAGMVDATSPSTVDRLAMLIGTIFGTANSLAGECWALEAKEADAHAKEAKAYALEVT